MKILGKIGLIIFFISLLSPVTALTESAPDLNHNDKNINYEIDFLKKLIKSNDEQIEILRRDQLDYKLEKDLLEKTYSANYQYLNLIFTVLLAFIGGFGIYGVVAINNIKKDYLKELNELKELKVKFDYETKSVSEKQKEVQEQINELSKDQELSLRVMEIIEKVVYHLNANNFIWALEWISKGLKINPNNPILLETKTHCLTQLNDLNGAVEACKKLVEITVGNPKHVKTVLNLMEILALLKNDEFNDYYQKYKDSISKEYNDNLISDFLRIFRSIINNDIEEAKELLMPFVNLSGGETFVHGFESLWSLENARKTISNLETKRQQELMTALIDFYSGKIDGKAVRELLVKNEQQPVP